MKTAIKIILISILCFTLISPGVAEELPQGIFRHFYPTTVVVRELDRINDILITEDYNGQVWLIEGIEDYLENDIISLIMYDNETDYIFDDIIIDQQYSGYANGL